MAELTKQEIDERVAILKRYKSLLEQQRNKFREYLKVLENTRIQFLTKILKPCLPILLLKSRLWKTLSVCRKLSCR